MVNVALVVALAAIWFFVGLPFQQNHVKWYKAMLGVFGGSRSTNSVGKRKLLQIPFWVIPAMWFVVSFCAFVALYIYWDGNCFFDQPRIFDEDDEIGKPGWDRGLAILVLFIITCWLKHFWVYAFFVRRLFLFAFFAIAMMVAMCVICLWAIATTPVCTNDTLENRYWISFGLYLAFTVWCTFMMLVNLNWFRVLGLRWYRKSEGYAIYKKMKSERKRKRHDHVPKLTGDFEGITEFK